jgi:hypothetical protein
MLIIWTCVLRLVVMLLLLSGSLVCDALARAIVVVLVWPVCVILEPLSDGADTSVGKVALAAAYFIKLRVRKAAVGLCRAFAHDTGPGLIRHYCLSMGVGGAKVGV